MCIKADLVAEYEEDLQSLDIRVSIVMCTYVRLYCLCNLISTFLYKMNDHARNLFDSVILLQQKKQKYLLNMILDQDCPSCVFGYLIENISSSDDCVIIEWVSDRINKMILEEEDMCKYSFQSIGLSFKL